MCLVPRMVSSQKSQVAGWATSSSFVFSTTGTATSGTFGSEVSTAGVISCTTGSAPGRATWAKACLAGWNLVRWSRQCEQLLSPLS